MFTAKMYELLSEWTSNLSLLFVGSVFVPLVTGTGGISITNITLGTVYSLISLWLSLRLARVSEGREFV